MKKLLLILALFNLTQLTAKPKVDKNPVIYVDIKGPFTPKNSHSPQSGWPLHKEIRSIEWDKLQDYIDNQYNYIKNINDNFKSEEERIHRLLTTHQITYSDQTNLYQALIVKRDNEIISINQKAAAYEIQKANIPTKLNKIVFDIANQMNASKVHFITSDQTTIVDPKYDVTQKAFDILNQNYVNGIN